MGKWNEGIAALAPWKKAPESGTSLAHPSRAQGSWTPSHWFLEMAALAPGVLSSESNTSEPHLADPRRGTAGHVS